jgi:hypothetical protein
MTGVVSDRARLGFDRFIAQGVKATLGASDFDCEVKQADDETPRERELVMFTVSSYLFRVLLFIHFDRNPITRGHFALLAGVTPEAMTNEQLDDQIMERGNLCCGALNRDLAQFYPHTGMSTPCLLNANSIDHIGALQPAFTRRYRAELSPGVALHFTVVACAFADLDFAFDASAAEEEAETAGELEMF